MNKSYRTIYNEALGAWVATSEIGRTGGRKKSAGVALVTVCLAACVFGAALPALAANECGVATPGTTVNCAPGSYPAGIGYSVDDVTVNVTGATDVGSSATPVAGAGVSNVGAGAGTSTVTTIGAVNIYTNANYGYGLYAGATGAGHAVASSSAATSIRTDGADGARGILAHAIGTGNATATNNGTVLTTGASGVDGNFGVYALAASGNATAANAGTVATGGTFGYGVYAVANGNGIATATSSGAVTTNGPYSTGIGAHIDNADASKRGTAIATLQSGGTVTTSGSPYGIGIFADVFGHGDAAATNAGTVSTQGQFAHGASARVFYGAGDATTVNQGAVSTSGIAANGLYAAVGAGGTGKATVQNSGTVSTTGSGSVGVFAQVTTAASTSAATAINDGGAVSTSGAAASGVLAENSGVGDAVVSMTNGAVTTAGVDSRGLYALVNNAASLGAASTSLGGGSITTSAQRAYGIQTENRGLGAATTTITGGAITASANFNSGVYTWINNSSNAAAATTVMSGGTINTSGLGTHGIQNSTNGLGASNGTLSGGTIATSGDSAYGFYSSTANPLSTATAMMTITSGSVTTTGASAHGAEGHTDGSGVGSLQMSGGTVSASGLNSDGVRAWSNLGTYDVDVTGGTITGGTGFASAIRTVSVAGGGGTIDIGAAATIDGSASGIAIRDGDPGYTGVDTVGGNAVVRTAGTVTGDAILGRGNDSFSLTAGSYTGDIYGDDKVASANDGNDSFVWSGGTLNSGFYGQNGSDTALVSAPAYNGSQILDGGDDVSAADGWVDRLTLQGVTATAGGATLRNWEVINLNNTRLTLAGAPLTVGAGADGVGSPMGLFINPTSTVAMGAPAFAITGDVHNAGVVDLRNPLGTPGNVLTVNGNYAGTNGLVRINTALGNDASATDKLVVNGNTSGTTRVQVNNTGGAGAPTVNGIQVVQVNGTSSAGNFTLASPVQAGAFEYGLQRGGNTDGNANSFYLSSVYAPPPPPQPEPPEPQPQPQPPQPQPEVWRPAVPGYVLGQVASNELGLGLLGSLHKRVGEQQTLKWDHCGCDGKAPGDQVWGRLHAQRLDIDGKRQFGFEQDLQFVQFGKDLSIAYSGDPGDKSRTHTGLSMGYGRTTTDFGDRRRGDAGMGYDTGKMKGQMATLGAYHTRYADNGSYLDLVGQLHAVHNKYTDKYGGEGTQKGVGLGLSAEIGRPWQIGESQWLIEPQAQLTYQATRYRAFSDSISSVDGFTSQSLRARLGGRLAWNDKSDRADKLTRTNSFYVTANLLHEFLKPETVTVGTTPVTEQLGARSWAEVGVGGQMALTGATYLYGGLQYQHALSGSGRQGVSAQVGLRAAW